ncbi:MAG: carbohydrate ABC transporter permease [Gaiella sp.]
MAEGTTEQPIVRQAPRRRLSDFGGRNDKAVATLLTTPGQLLMLFIAAFPAGVAIYIAFTEWNPTSGDDVWGAYNYWHWFDGYWEALTSSNFWSAMLRTVLFLVVAVGLEFVLGFLLALLFLEEFRGRGVLTLFFLLPMMVVPAVSGFIFFMLFQVDGPVNDGLSIILGRDIAIQWLADPSLALWSAMVVDIWQWTPLMFLILLSGLVSLPEDQMNQARILGASFWHRFRYLILPMMKPIILIALIIRSIEVFKVFDAPFLLTGGGPGNASETISIYLYRQTIENSRWGYASAVAIIVLIFVTTAGIFAVKPIEAAQDESLDELVGGAADEHETVDVETAVIAESHLR